MVCCCRNEELYNKIARLESKGLIPRNIAICMHGIRKRRNLAVKEQYEFAGAEANAVRAEWDAIRAWAIVCGYGTHGLPD